VTRVFVFLVCALFALAIVAGFATVGGPGQARDEAEDRGRLSVASQLSVYLTCTRPETALPETIALDDLNGYCGKPAPASNIAQNLGKPWLHYTIAETDDFRICADLLRPETERHESVFLQTNRFTFDPQKPRACIAGKDIGADVPRTARP